MTFTLQAVLYAIAVVILFLAFFPIPEPFGGKLVTAGLLFVALGLFVGSVGV